MQVNMHEAKTRLSQLIEAAKQGEEVIIARDNEPMVRLVPIHKGKFRMGGLEHLAGTVPDFLEPTSEEDLRAWEGRD